MLAPALRTILLPLLAVLAAITLPLVAARAQSGDPVSVRVDAPQKMYVGDSAELHIVVTGSKAVDAPDLSTLKDFEAVYRGPNDMTSSMTTIINGRIDTKVNITYSHVYAITPKRAGQLEIPALTVLIDGRAHTTQPVTIEVVEPAQASDFTLRVTAEPANAFVGQPILVRYIWSVGKQIEAVQLSLPITGAEHDTILGPEIAQLNPRDPRAVQIRLNGEPANATYQNSVLTIDRVIVPTKSGVLTIGPPRADFLTIIGRRERQPLDAPWTNRNITERQFSVAPAIVVPVSDLPTAGRPTDFSCLVGTYTIAATADAANVSVGDPININIGVTGPYPLTLVPPLDLNRQSTLRRDFRIPREPALPQVTPAVAAFTTMIRARNADVQEIGPITISYFDPDARQYRTASTKPIPITVRASGTITLPDDPVAATSSNEPAPPKRPGGLPDIDRTPLQPDASQFVLADAFRSPSTLALLIVPPLACAATAIAVATRRRLERDPAAMRRRAALAHLRRTLNRSRPDSLDDVARALSNFAADSFDEPRDTLTGAQAAGLLTDTGTPAGAELARLLSACDESRFGASRPPTPALDLSPRSLTDRALSAARAFAAELAQHRRRAPA